MGRNTGLAFFAVTCLALAGCNQTLSEGHTGQIIETRSGQPVIVEQLISWKPDCSYPGKPEVRVLNVDHGTVSLQEGTSIIPKGSAAGKCGGKRIRATHVIYTPASGYRGTAHITFEVTPRTVNKTIKLSRYIRVE